jgi:hypothetical protein
VKHSCVKGLPSHARTAGDVSRETVFSAAAHSPARARCFT